jgi:hypothetical protein
MKELTLKITLFFLTIIIITACSNSDSNDILDETIIDEENPLIELTFSSSPIDLQGLDVQFAADVPYDQYEDTKFDIFLPNATTTTSLVVFIHGGGFTGGDKAFAYTNNYPEDIVQLLSNNIAVATINYRLIQSNDTECFKKLKRFKTRLTVHAIRSQRIEC